MAELNETPNGNRIRIAFFGLRNAGKSTLVNAFTGQPIAIVSAVAGTTTDPVSKAMEILPLGPCLITDTAGLDDVGELGRQRVGQSLKVLETTDIAVWVHSAGDASAFAEFASACRRRNVTVLAYRRGDSVEDLKRQIAALKLADDMPGLLDGLVNPGDRVICVCPIDAAAPKGRLILPQVQVLRACLDLGVTATVCQPRELASCLSFCRAGLAGKILVITDSQAFGEVSAILGSEREGRALSRPTPRPVELTSFSILFARQKGDLEAYRAGLRRLGELKDGDRVLVAEGCTHHRQCNDIGTVKIPKALEKLSGRRLVFEFASGGSFAVDGQALIVQCGGCMLTRREVMRRIAVARAAGVPIVNYGMLLAKAAGCLPERSGD